MSTGSVQVRIDLDSIEHGVATFGTGAHAHRITVLDVVAAEQSLSTADDDKQEEILASCARFLNAQIDEFQVLVRAEPVDLARHVELIEERALDLGTELAAVAREYVAFLPALAQQRTLLDRRCHIVLPVAAEATRRLSLPGRLQRAIGRQKIEGGAENDAVRRLAGRSDEAARQLLRSGLRTRRMDDVLFAQLYHRCWSPDLARTQRLRRELRDFSTLVVGGARPALDNHSDKHDGAAIHGGTNSRSRARPPVDDRLLLALGGRTLADLVAPSGCDVRRDHLRIDDHYVRVLTLVAYPRTVSAGWLAPLVEGELPVDVSVHVRPLPSAAMVRALSLQIAKLEASRRARIRGELVPDVERDVALEDAERLRDRLQRGEERIFSVAMYLMVRATSRRELDDLTRRVETVLDGMLAQSRRNLWEQERGFRSCLPEGRDQLLVTRNLDTSALAATLPLVGSTLSMERGVLYGISPRTQAPIVVDLFDDTLDNPHLVIVAPSGSGKSYFVKLMALRHLIMGVDFVVVDPEDEYQAVASVSGGTVIRLALSSAHHLNPLDLVLPDPGTVLGGSTGAFDEALALVAARLELLLCAEAGANGGPGTLDAYERTVLMRALRDAFAREWADDDGHRGGMNADEPTTHVRPAPLLRDLHHVLAGFDGDLAPGLAMRLERHMRSGPFAASTDVLLDQKLVVFQIRDLPKELWPLAIHQIAGFVWNRARRKPAKPRRLVVDEAATLLSHPSGGAFLAELARRARKYYLGLTTLTQKIQDLTNSEHGDTILSNSATKLLLKQTSEIVDAADSRFRFTAEERQWLLAADKGEGLLLVGGRRLPIKIIASPSEHRVATTNPRELAMDSPTAEHGRLAAEGSTPLAELLARRALA